MTLPPQDPQIDPVSVLTALVSIAISAELARYVAPYIVIGAAGLVGSAFALARSDEAPGLRWIGHVAWYTSISLLLTAPISYWLQGWLGVEVRWLLAPVSGMVAGIGPDWPRVARWGLDRLRGAFDRKAGASE